MKKAYYYIFFLWLIISATSCTTFEIPEAEPLDPLGRKITYQEDIKTIIDNNCISCHGISSPQAGLTLLTYEQVKESSKTRGLISRMNSSSNPMPPSGKLSQEKLNLIDKWKNDGYIKNK